eukprot:Gb_11552 [translate_table: standard]
MAVKEDEEGLAPVLYVSKNGTIIQTILLHSLSEQTHAAEEKTQETDAENAENGQIFLVGRHPDCHIVLDHPSISRCHLQIHLQKSSQELILTDLSSVHGTWVCGKRATPQIPVILRPNDTFKLGASSRLYNLQWVPFPLAILEEESHSVLGLAQGLLPEKQSQHFGSNENICGFEDENKVHSAKENGNLGSVEPVPWIPVQPSAPPLPECPSPPRRPVLMVKNETQMQENQSPLRETAGGGEVSNLWCRRQKNGHLVRLQTGRMEGTSSVKKPKENLLESSKETGIMEQGKNGSVLQELQPVTSVHGSSDTGIPAEDEECYPSDKENLTPQVSCRTSKLNTENLTPQVLGQKFKVNSENNGTMGREIRSRTDIERVPFQSLSLNSKTNSRPPTNSSLKNTAKIMQNHRRPVASEVFVSLNCSGVRRVNVWFSGVNVFDLALYRPTYTECTGHSIQVHSVDQVRGQVQHLNLAESKTKWHMVVDTGCLIDDESRQALKQLEGIKGTRLIIPKIVVRELDCLKRRNTSRTVNEAPGILRWIEECMVKMGWWIHVQNSTESLSIGVTPPASPHSHLSDGSNDAAASIAFSSYGSFMDVLSPTAEDHILECALLFNRLATDGRVVLLTNDIALKIKAMAEGLVSENAKDFCQSLVSPYSERFLWAQSTAHGHNWTHFNQNNSSNSNFCMRRTKSSSSHGEEEFRKKSNEGAKGLKLILLHNSHYGQKNIMK